MFLGNHEASDLCPVPHASKKLRDLAQPVAVWAGSSTRLHRHRERLCRQRSNCYSLTISSPPSYPYSCQPAPKSRTCCEPSLQDHSPAGLTSNIICVIVRPHSKHC